MNSQRGGFFLGMIVGLLIGLALALGVALYITKVPLPFIDKVPQRTAEQDAEEAEHNAVNGQHEDADPHEQGLSRERIDGQRPLPARRPHHADPD